MATGASPFGDGQAARRIISILEKALAGVTPSDARLDKVEG
jgi:UDP-N-acetylglucosamine 2-epimerase